MHALRCLFGAMAAFLAYNICLPARAAEIVTDDLIYNWDASDDATAGANFWNSTTSNTARWELDATGGDAITRDSIGPTSTIFTQGYSFQGGNGGGDETIDQSRAFFDDNSDNAPSPLDEAFAPGESALSTSSLTIEMWIRPNDLSGKEIIAETGGTTRGFYVGLDDDVLQFAVRDGPNNTTNPAGSELLETTLTNQDIEDLIQIAVTVNDSSGTSSGGTQDLGLYVNGALVASGSFDNDHVLGTSGATLGGADSSLGGGHNSSGIFNIASFDGFFGSIAAFRVYDDALTAEEVLQNFQAAQQVPEPASIAIWSLMALALAGYGFYRRRRKS